MCVAPGEGYPGRDRSRDEVHNCEDGVLGGKGDMGAEVGVKGRDNEPMVSRCQGCVGGMCGMHEGRCGTVHGGGVLRC